MSETAPASKPIRLSILINAESQAALMDYCLHHGTTVTEAIRQMIGTVTFLDNAERAGARIIVQRRWPRHSERVFLNGGPK